jgi:hypothetical protein
MGGGDEEQVLAHARAFGLGRDRGLKVRGHPERKSAHLILLGTSAGGSATMPKRADGALRSRKWVAAEAPVGEHVEGRKRRGVIPVGITADSDTGGEFAGGLISRS